MANIILMLILMSQYMGTQNTITIENDVLTDLSLPAYGVLCKDVNVMNAPEGSKILYELPKGTKVQLREQSQSERRDWVMIEATQWIPLTALCD